MRYIKFKKMALKIKNLQKTLQAAERKSFEQEKIIAKLQIDLLISRERENELENLFSGEDISRFLMFSKKVFSLWGSKSDFDAFYTEGSSNEKITASKFLTESHKKLIRVNSQKKQGHGKLFKYAIRLFVNQKDFECPLKIFEEKFGLLLAEICEFLTLLIPDYDLKLQKKFVNELLSNAKTKK